MKIFTNSHSDKKKQYTFICGEAEVIQNTHCGLGCWEPDVVCRYVWHEVAMVIFPKLGILIEKKNPFSLLLSDMKP